MRPSDCAECQGALDPYLPDCPHCGARVEGESDTHHDRDIVVHRDAGGNVAEVRRRWRLHVPWGLFIILGLYGAAAYGYVQYSDRTSPETRAAQHLMAAERILGPDNGDSAKSEDLLAAYRHLIEALALTPADAWGHTQLERVGWALARRGQKPPPDLKRQADFLGAQWSHIQQDRSSQFPESPRERFGFDAIEDSAGRLRQYLLYGGAVILLFWIYREFQEYKFLHKRDDEHELVRRDELRALDSHRRR